jgi:hypothetical protein
VNWIDLAWDSHVAGSCEHDNEPSGFIKCGESFWLTEKLLAS